MQYLIKYKNHTQNVLIGRFKMAFHRLSLIFSASILKPAPKLDPQNFNQKSVTCDVFIVQ